MKVMLRTLGSALLGLSLLGATTIASAGSCNALSCTGNVKKVYFTDSGILYIELNGLSFSDDTGCGPVGHPYARVEASNPKIKEIYAMALTAFSTDETMFIRINTADPECDLNYSYVVK